MASVLSVTATNNAEIDGLLGGTKWSGTIAYSFPTSPSIYAASYGFGEADDPGFASVSAPLQSALQYAIGLISSYTNATIVFSGSGSSDVMIAQSPVPNPTSWAYLPDPTYSEGGDAWFGTDYDFSQAALGNYYFMDALHELGHSFGLKHSNTPDGVANVVVPTDHDDSEYTVMSYRSYVGAADTGFLTNEDYGYAQTYMANDILAFQTLYGANYSTHSENTVYSWNPTTGQASINGVAQLAPGGGTGGTANRVFETIWDGNGVDTYDLSNYTTDLAIDLNPGASSIISTEQLAYLGDGHYAAGNVYNAYLFNGDARSYIDNAIGGSGNDTITGNAIANVLNAGSGNDTLIGGGGNDTIIGGAGTDVAVFSGTRSNYLISYNSGTLAFTVTDQRTGSPDGTDTLTGVENFQFLDGTFPSASLTGVPPGTVVTNGTNGNDILVDGALGNALYGMGGNDYIYAGGGNDFLFGGDGLDILLGESGDDAIYGGTGFNYLFGGIGDDKLFGAGGSSGADVNVLYGDAGADALYGGAGTNYFYGGSGIDTMFGGSGLNIFISSAETDGNFIYGGSGQNYVYGSNGGDTVAGGAGVDVFLMGAGADQITGGGGVDYAWGGGGSDTFTINDATFEVMVIQDFNAGGVNDILNFSGTSLHSFHDLQAASFYAAGINTTIVTDAAGNAAWLIGVAPGQLTANMFSFR